MFDTSVHSIFIAVFGVAVTSCSTAWQEPVISSTSTAASQTQHQEKAPYSQVVNAALRPVMSKHRDYIVSSNCIQPTTIRLWPDSSGLVVRVEVDSGDTQLDTDIEAMLLNLRLEPPPPEMPPPIVVTVRMQQYRIDTR